ncbi:MAG TPA: chemotaxis protein CheR [Chloroflexi bacterium]|nr:chemotaxis protein CheR [Chloroflexota bacterium]
MNKSEQAQLEIDLLVEAIFRRYGYDFRHYSRASLKRRLENHITQNGVTSIADLIPRILQDESAFQDLLFDISVTVTEMFRDPWFFAALREKVLPFLSTFPFINIWQAGCATGEEVYSLAILLQEEGLYSRCRIYATDFNSAALEKAKARIYPLKRMREYNQNYQQAGGKGSLSDYYLAQYDAAIFDPALQEKVTFASHNLATDGVFGEMHLILCRNVLIYFDRPLQNRVLNIFRKSLRHNGFLCLGSRESIDFTEISQSFTVLSSNERIYHYKGVTDGLGLKR